MFKITELIHSLAHYISAGKGKGETAMVHMSIIEARLSKLGFRVSRWFRAEVRELQNVLMEHEHIVTLAQGRYFGGFAMLIATDQRILLIDKKALFLNIEDIRYDMISEIDYNARLIDATISIFTVNKQHRFTSVKNRKHLRELATYAQRRIMELRQYPGQTLDNALAESTVRHIPLRARRLVQSMAEPVATPPSFSRDLSQSMGATALHAFARTNPYVAGSLTAMRRQWSTL